MSVTTDTRLENTDHARRPWVAAILSAVLPGFGHWYNGDANSAIWIYLIFVLLTVPGMALAALALPASWMVPVLAVSLLLAIMLWGYGIVHSFWRARQLRHYQLKPYQISGIYALILITFGFLLLPGLMHMVRKHLVHAFVIPSNSMAPTLLSGDFLFADKRYNCPGCKVSVSRGDIAIFVYPNNRNRYYIKRIAGLPGDRVSTESGLIKVQSAPSSGSPSESFTYQSSTSINVPEETVKAGSVYFLGDNIDDSTDSRQFGQVPLADVVGVARQIWFSRGSEGIRWERIGNIL